MITLESSWDYVWLFVVAGGFGAVGGLAYELLQVRAHETGTLELPGGRGSQRFVDLGFFASIILGAIAAIAITYFFTPEVLVKTGPPGSEVITTKWQIVKVVPLSIIVGSAGGAFLTTMQTRALAQLNAQRAETNAQKAQTTAAVSKTAVAQLAAAATAASQVAAAMPRAEADSVSAKAAGDIAVHANLATEAIDEALNS